jgi:signal transduction histidine kinase
MVMSVRDHGIGISSTALPHIFERGYRAPEAIAAAPGLGLGLNISAEIIRRHGGAMQASAANSQGTVVTVRLPLLRGSTESMSDVALTAAATRESA